MNNAIGNIRKALIEEELAPIREISRKEAMKQSIKKVKTLKDYEDYVGKKKPSK
jgi:hypothetical protein